MKLTVLGPGCWGLTLAWLLTDNFEEVCVWGRSSDISDELRNYKRTTKPLTVQLAEKVDITDNLKEAINGADIILLVVATSGIRPVCKQLKEEGLKDNQILVNLSKG
ncbi:NAD(P)-binding domain-containing protein, partial [bacterium]|nr:NAD(P)-binding domain-containing protein [bacterium]